MASVILREELRCSICLSVFKDPVMLRCGHNFCWICIDRLLDTQDRSGVYSCPECREEFQDRSALMRNINLRNVAESFLITQPNQEEITGICCTYCVDSTLPAVKFCLLCEASLCDKHLKTHNKSPEHVLSEPRSSLKNRKCSVHKKILEYYCTEDAACICASCSLDGQHRGHGVETLEEASKKKKKKLRNVLPKLSTKREETEKRIQNLKQQRRKAEKKANEDIKRATDIIANIKTRLETIEERVKWELERQKQEVLTNLSIMVYQLEKKEKDLSRKMRHIEELCNMTDPLTVLQEPDTGDLCDPEEREGDEDTWRQDEPPDDLHDLDVVVISYKLHKLSDILSGIRKGIYMDTPADIILDVNTADNKILISDDLKTATCSQLSQNRPKTAERFQHYPQVLSSSIFLSGRHHWDVEISESRSWRVGMCYPSMDRRGSQSYIGDNNKSWILRRKKTWCSNYYFVIHNREEIWLTDNISSNRFRIRLDYGSGQLSFYELCDPIRHLHTFTATFTEPLHAVLCVWEGSIKILEGAATNPSRN